MPPRKSDVTLVVTAYGESFSLNCEEVLFNRFRVKRGRSLSKQMPDATLCEIYETARKWTVAQQKKNGKFKFGKRMRYSYG